jgi:hypothetical protein
MVLRLELRLDTHPQVNGLVVIAPQQYKLHLGSIFHGLAAGGAVKLLLLWSKDQVVLPYDTQ